MLAKDLVYRECSINSNYCGFYEFSSGSVCSCSVASVSLSVLNKMSDGPLTSSCLPSPLHRSYMCAYN